MEQLPELIEGQPPWVVVVVALLLAGAGVAVAFVKRGRSEDDDEPDRPAPDKGVRGTVAPAGDGGALTIALNHLADTARSERAEAEQARRETEALRARYEERSGEVMTLRTRLTTALADLEDCERRISRRSR